MGDMPRLLCAGDASLSKGGGAGDVALLTCGGGDEPAGIEGVLVSRTTGGGGSRCLSLCAWLLLLLRGDSWGGGDGDDGMRAGSATGDLRPSNDVRDACADWGADCGTG